MKHRKDEENDDKVHFRSERVFAVNNNWFFLSRELKEPVGPYTSREDAERHQKFFINEIQKGRSVPEAVENLRLLTDPFSGDDY